MRKILLNWLRIIGIITIASFLLYVLFGNHLLPYFTDYPAFATGGKLMLEEDKKDFYNFLHQRQVQEVIMGEHDYGALLPFVYTPITALMFLPLGILSTQLGYRIYFLINFLLLMFTAGIFVKNIMGTKRLSNYFLLPMIFVPSILVLINIQLGVFILFLFTVIFILFKRDNEPQAAFVSGLLIIKPQFLVIIPFLFAIARNKKKYLIYFSLSIMLSLFFFVGVLGFEQLYNYPSVIGFAEAPTFGNFTDSYVSLSNLTGNISGTWKDYLILVIFYSLSLVFFFKEKNSMSLERSFSLILFLSLLFSHHTHTHDAAALVLFVWILLKKIESAKQTNRKFYIRDLVLILTLPAIAGLIESHYIQPLVYLGYALYLYKFGMGYSFDKVNLPYLKIGRVLGSGR